IVLATAGKVAESALELAGPANLAGKTIIGACNPIADTPPVEGVLSYFTGRGQRADDRSAVCTGHADDVLLRQRRGREGAGGGRDPAVRLGAVRLRRDYRVA